MQVKEFWFKTQKGFSEENIWKFKFQILSSNYNVFSQRLTVFYVDPLRSPFKKKTFSDVATECTHLCLRTRGRLMCPFNCKNVQGILTFYGKGKKSYMQNSEIKACALR